MSFRIHFIQAKLRLVIYILKYDLKSQFRRDLRENYRPLVRVHSNKSQG